MEIRYFIKIAGQLFSIPVLLGANPPLNMPLKYLGTIPKNFCCPITKDIMKDPVTTRNGTYERSAIVKHLEKINNTNSQSNKYDNSELRQDFDLKNRIHDWMVNNSILPKVAKNNKDEYRQFIKSKLVYEPNSYNLNNRIEFPFTTLSNPLSEKFDLSLCKAARGNIPYYFDISTGFRESEDKKRKMQIWIMPRFVAENITLYQEILDSWPKNYPIGLFYNWGNWPLNWFAYQTNIPLERLYRENFMELFKGVKLHNVRAAYPYHTLPNLNCFKLRELGEVNSNNTTQERLFRKFY